MAPLRQGRGRPVCVQGVDALPALFLPEEQQSPHGLGCSGASLALGSALCLSSLHPSPASSPKSSGGASAAYTVGSSVAPHAVVLSDSTPAGWVAMGAPAPEGPALPGERSPVPPLSRGAQAGGMAPERDRLLALGLPEPVAATIQHAWAPSTRADFSYHWQVFTTWCVSHQVEPYLALAQEILRFLQSQLEAHAPPPCGGLSQPLPGSTAWMWLLAPPLGSVCWAWPDGRHFCLPLSLASCGLMERRLLEQAGPCILRGPCLFPLGQSCVLRASPAALPSHGRP